MSEKFGPGWKEYEYNRMADFITIAKLEAEKINKANKKAGKNNFR